jgi:molecular chaperone GrpE
MKKNEQDNEDIEIEITENEHTDKISDEQIDIENNAENKIKKLRTELSNCDEEKRNILEDLQRTKADFLNARKRLDEDRQKDKARYQMDHVLELLPLCDSFEMAMSNKEAWEKADKNWRIGVEGINSQLLKILESYRVSVLNPLGETFDPYRHEAIGTIEVENVEQKDKVIKVVQSGYEMKVGDKAELIRPARVTTGIIK